MNVLLLAVALLPWAVHPASLFTRIFVAISLFSVEMQVATLTGAASLRSLVVLNAVLAAALAAWQWRRDGPPFRGWSAALLPVAPWPIVAALAALVLVLNVTLPLQAADPYHLDRVAQIERLGALDYDPAADSKINIVGWLYELVLADLRQVPVAGTWLVRLHGVLGLLLLGAALAAAQTWLPPPRSRWTLAALLVIPPLFHELVLIKNDVFLALPAFVALVWMIVRAESASWQDGVWAGWLVGLAIASKLTNLPLAIALVGGIAIAQRLRDWRPIGGVVLGGAIGALAGGLLFTMYANNQWYGDPFASGPVAEMGNINEGVGEALAGIARFGISLVDLGQLTPRWWPGRGGWGGTFGLPVIWALGVLVLHARLREARWALAIATMQFLVFAAVFPDADLTHRLVLAPALVAVAVAVYLVNGQERHRRLATVALLPVLVLTAAQILRSAMLYLAAA